MKAKRRHGIHSPFVYDIQDVCLKRHIPKEVIKQRDQLFHALASDQTVIQVSDFGAGSKKLSNNRKIKDIFRHSSSHGKYADLLFQFTSYFKPANILEFGTSLGVGSFHLKTGYPNARVITVEGCEHTSKAARKHLNKIGIDDIQFIHSTFNRYIESDNIPCFDLIYIDGHHDGEALKEYVNRLLPHSHADTLFILDDIRWSKSMLEAWEFLYSSSDFNLSLDYFRMGILVRRPQQAKEHFLLRY
jgi:predicted O-methyltransferase YrrM